MKKTYKFLTKSLIAIIIGAILTSILGTIAFVLGYNDQTSWLRLRGACTIIFAIVGFATMCYAVFMSVKAKDIHIEKIRRSSGFSKTASCLAFLVLFFIFGHELIKIILASYQDKFGAFFSIWRILKFVFALPCSLYFLIMALPSKYKRKKIKVPKMLQYITGVSTVVWAIFGLLATYFYAFLATKNILKIWQILVYLVFTVFFLFEIKFEHIKPCPRAYICISSLTFITTMAFTLTTIISLACGIIPPGMSFSATELICSLTIGIYALSRVYAITDTMKYVLITSDKGSHSSKFDKHHHHHHHHSSHNTDNDDNTGNTPVADEK